MSSEPLSSEPRPDPRVYDASAALHEACGGAGDTYAAALAVAGMVTLYTLLIEKGIATREEVLSVYCEACRKLGVEMHQMQAFREALGDG